MANYYEKISVLIDVTTDKAVNGFNNFKTAVKDAEGFQGKFKAGVGSLKQSLGGLITGPAGIAAAGTAIAAAGAYAFDAAGKFVNLARQSRDLGTATGLTTEEASRLIEVFGDLGGDAGQLQGTLSKIPKTLDSGKWEEYGIATRDAGGELRSTNDILLDGIDALGRITDPTARAQAGIDLFGKSWGNLAPLIGKSRDELDGMLDSVSSGKTITDAETKRAEKLAAAQDELGDAFEDVTLEVGQLVAKLSPLLKGIATTVGQIIDAAEALGIMEEATTDTSRVVDEFGQDVAFMGAEELALAAAFRPANDVIDEQGNILLFASEAAYEKYIADHSLTGEQIKIRGAIGQSNDSLKEQAERLYKAATDAAELERKLANRRGGVAFAAAQAEQSITDMMDAISDDRQWIAVQLAMDDLEERLADLKRQYDDGEIDQREYWLRTRDEILATKADLTGYLDELEDMDPYLKQRILFEFDQGDLNTVLKLMQDYLDGKQITVGVGNTSVPGMPWIPGGTGPKDGPYGSGVVVNVNMGVVGDPLETGRTIVKLIQDYNNATGGWGGAGRI